MKKITLLIGILAVVIGIQPLFAQTETFDIATYTPPKGWRKDSKQGLQSYITVDPKKGGFCLIVVYTATPSKGTPEKDFASEWNDLIVKPYNAEKEPKTETQTTPDGWKEVVGAAPIKKDSIDSYILLTVFSGFDKTVSVMANLNDQTYLPEIDKFLETIKLDKDKVLVTTTTPSNQQPTAATSSSIVGVWGNQNSSIGNYVNSSGVFLGSADAHTMEEYTFSADHSYLYKFFGSSGGSLYYTETTGSYTINGKNLTLTPVKRRGGYSGTIHDEKNLLEKPSTFNFYIGPNKWDAGPYLNLHKEGTYYPWADYPYDYYKLVSTAAASKTTPAATIGQSATPEKLGHLIYTPISGWTLSKYTTAAILTPSAIPDDEYLEVRIMAAMPFTGALQQALATTWNEALQQLIVTPVSNPAYNITTEKKSYKGWDYIRAEGIVKIDKDKSHDYKLYLFLIQLEDRVERVVVISLLKRRPDNIYGFTRSYYDNPEYQDKIDSFLFSFKFDDRKETDYPNGSLKGNSIVGLYAGLRQNALAGAQLEGTYAVLFSNGQVYYREKLPAESFDGINTWIAAERNIRNWGTYTLQNGKGNLKFGYGPIPARMNGNDLILTTQNTEHTYVKVPSVDGVVFNGTYTFPGDWSTSSDPSRKAPTITFTADGKFTDHGMLNIINHQSNGPFDVTTEPGNGTYEVKNYTLLFYYSDGRKLQIAFPGLNYDRKNQSPAKLVLSFNNDELVKK